MMGIDDSRITVQLAAVKCLHSLSRSVHQLRTTFQDNAVWKPLMKLLQGASEEVLKVASSAVCNLLLEFSPSKEVNLKNQINLSGSFSNAMVTRQIVIFLHIVDTRSWCCQTVSRSYKT